METVVCNLCGSSRYRELYRMPDLQVHLDEWFTVVECCDCGLGFVNPRPSYQEMGNYYPEHYYEYFSREQTLNERRYEIEADLVEKVARSAVRRLLDVGCAYGDFPRVMRKRGWKVEGVEVFQHAKPICDFLTYAVPFPEIPVCGPRYGVVTAWAVLEHVHDPSSYFKKASELLVRDGLFIFLIPNFESVSSRYLFREDVPRHLYFLTREHVERYLNRCDMQLVDTMNDDRIYGMQAYNWLHYYLYFRLRKKKYTFEDSLFSRQQYLASRGLPESIVNSIKFVARYPHAVFDRALRGSFERLQIVNGTYGISTYVAKKKSI